MNVNELIGKLNDPRLKKSITELANTPKGKEVLKKLENFDRQKLEMYVNNVNSNNISPEMLLRQIQNNPRLLDQLNNLLSKM